MFKFYKTSEKRNGSFGSNHLYKVKRNSTEGSISNGETLMMTMNQKSGYENAQTPQEYLGKMDTKTDNSANFTKEHPKARLQGQGTSEMTDLSSTKSGRILTRHISESKMQTVKIKPSQVTPVNEKFSLNRLKSARTGEVSVK